MNCTEHDLPVDIVAHDNHEIFFFCMECFNRHNKKSPFPTKNIKKISDPDLVIALKNFLDMLKRMGIISKDLNTHETYLDSSIVNGFKIAIL